MHRMHMTSVCFLHYLCNTATVFQYLGGGAYALAHHPMHLILQKPKPMLDPDLHAKLTPTLLVRPSCAEHLQTTTIFELHCTMVTTSLHMKSHQRCGRALSKTTAKALPCLLICFFCHTFPIPIAPLLVWLILTSGSKNCTWCLTVPSVHQTLCLPSTTGPINQQSLLFSLHAPSSIVLCGPGMLVSPTQMRRYTQSIMLLLLASAMSNITPISLRCIPTLYMECVLWLPAKSSAIPVAQATLNASG